MCEYDVFNVFERFEVMTVAEWQKQFGHSDGK
jgi:hypothetical protein